MKRNQSQPEAPADQKTAIADESIPEKILEAARLDSERDRLRAELAKCEAIVEEFPELYKAALLEVDPDNSKDMQRIGEMRSRFDSAKAKAEFLDELLAIRVGRVKRRPHRKIRTAPGYRGAVQRRSAETRAPGAARNRHASLSGTP